MPGQIRYRWAALAAAGALAACGQQAAEKPAAAPPPTPVQIVAAEAAGGIGAVRASGVIGYLREPNLAFRTPGVIERIMVDEGDVVSRGQRLAWLRPTDVAANASQTQAALDNAERNLARTQTLFDKGFVAQARLDDAKLGVAQAKAARDAAGFSRDTAVIVAPAGGVILRRQAEPSQIAAAGQPILILGETNSGLIARVSVSGADARRIKLGDKASVRVDAASFAGKVARIAAKGDGATGAFDVEIALEAAKELRSGMVAQADIAAAAAAGAKAAVQIPTLALLDARADQGFVFVVDAKGVASRRAVQTAGVDGETVTVLQGLAPGDRVVSAGAAYIRDGEPVVEAPAPAAAAPQSAS